MVPFRATNEGRSSLEPRAAGLVKLIILYSLLFLFPASIYGSSLEVKAFYAAILYSASQVKNRSRLKSSPDLYQP